MHVCPSGVKGKHPFPGPPGKMIQRVIYKIPITKMDLESGAVCMNHLSQIIKNKALPKCSSKLVLSGVFNKSTRLFTWSSGELGMKKHSKSSPVLCKSLQSRPTLCDPMDCNQSGSSVHGILQGRILEWVAMPCFRGSSWPKDQTCISYVSCIGRWLLYCLCHLGNPTTFQNGPQSSLQAETGNVTPGHHVQRLSFWTGVLDNRDLASGCYFSSWVENGNWWGVRSYSERRLFMRLVCTKLQSP